MIKWLSNVYRVVTLYKTRQKIEEYRKEFKVSDSYIYPFNYD